jgi:hypothetical protein
MLVHLDQCLKILVHCLTYGGPTHVTCYCIIESIFPDSHVKSHILNGEVFDYVSSYQYLGLVLNEFLDYLFMAKAVARSASRALGLIIVDSYLFTINIYTNI